MAGDDQGALSHRAGDTPARRSARPARITPRHVVIAGLGLAVLVFIFQNTDTASLDFLVFSFQAPLWLMLTVLVLVSMAIGVLLGRRSARPKGTKKP